jgi:D-serine deaminase-like pyridoxal phosphate-dependent protein
MQDLADKHHVNLRPHIKTHKSIKIANLQIEQGASGITASKVDEALVFLKAGINSITLAQPLLSPSKIDRLFQAALEPKADVRMIMDSAEGLDLIVIKAEAHSYIPGVFIKIDVGLNRCGLKEEDERVVRLAETIHNHPCLKFCGLLSHAGHAYAAADANGVAQIAENERRQMLRIKDALEKENIPVAEISVGSTPTVLGAENFDRVTEIRPGNYVFLDQNPLRLGLVQPGEVSLTVLATIISKNSDYFITDTGSKTLTSDQGAHGIATKPGFGVGYPAENYEEQENPLIVAKLSEEHGFIAREGQDLPLGSKIRIIPNHSCPVANLAHNFVVIKESDKEFWPVDAGGRVR